MMDGKLRSKGNALTQYAIVLALLAVVLVPSFFMIGGTITQNFVDFYETLSGKKYAHNTQSAQQTANSQDGNVSEGVNINCNGNDCEISINEAITLDISGDLSEIIETSGAAGATDHLASALSQLADQAESLNVSEEDKRLIYQLADQAKVLSQYEQNAEQYSKDITTIIDACISNFDVAYYSTLKTQAQRENYFEEVLTPIENKFNNLPEIIQFYNMIHHIGGTEPVGDFMGAIAGVSSPQMTDADTIMYQFKQTKGSLNASNIDPSLKSIINVLSDDVEMLANNMYDSFQNNIDYEALEDIENLINTNKGQASEVESDLVYTELTYELSFMKASFDGVANANDGLTSEQTDLDSKLMQAAAEAKEEEKADEKSSQQDEDKEDVDNKDGQEDEESPEGQEEPSGQ